MAALFSSLLPPPPPPPPHQKQPLKNSQLPIYRSYFPTSSSRTQSLLLPSSSDALSLSRKQPTTSRFEPRRPKTLIVAAVADHRDPLKVMISGAPASGKGTQCELIVRKHDLVHISAGDLLRAEIGSGTQNGKKAKEYMTRGELVPNEIVVNIVKERLDQSDVKARGWLLDGYPRSLSQALAIETLGIRPDVFILLDVPDEILIDRVVGRRLDPETGKIYHIKYFPPENEEIAGRLIQRFDDTEHQAKLRLQTHSRNVDDVLSTYKDVIRKVDGDRPKEVVFEEIDGLLSDLIEKTHQPVVGSSVHGPLS